MTYIARSAPYCETDLSHANEQDTATSPLYTVEFEKVGCRLTILHPENACNYAE